MPVTLTSVERRFPPAKGRSGCTLIRHGKTQIEIPGGEEELRRWVEEHMPTDEQKIAMQLAEHFKADPSLSRLNELAGKQVGIELSTATTEVPSG